MLREYKACSITKIGSSRCSVQGICALCHRFSHTHTHSLSSTLCGGNVEADRSQLCRSGRRIKNGPRQLTAQSRVSQGSRLAFLGKQGSAGVNVKDVEALPRDSLRQLRQTHTHDACACADVLTCTWRPEVNLESRPLDSIYLVVLRKHLSLA